MPGVGLGRVKLTGIGERAASAVRILRPEPGMKQIRPELEPVLPAIDQELLYSSKCSLLRAMNVAGSPITL